MGARSAAPRHLLLAFEPRASTVRVRLSGQGVSVEIVAGSGQEAGERALECVRLHGRSGDRIDVQCGSRLLGVAMDPQLVAALVWRAVAPL